MTFQAWLAALGGSASTNVLPARRRSAMGVTVPGTSRSRRRTPAPAPMPTSPRRPAGAGSHRDDAGDEQQRAAGDLHPQPGPGLGAGLLEAVAEHARLVDVGDILDERDDED